MKLPKPGQIVQIFESDFNIIPGFYVVTKVDYDKVCFSVSPWKNPETYGYNLIDVWFRSGPGYDPSKLLRIVT